MINWEKCWQQDRLIALKKFSEIDSKDWQPDIKERKDTKKQLTEKEMLRAFKHV